MQNSSSPRILVVGIVKSSGATPWPRTRTTITVVARQPRELAVVAAIDNARLPLPRNVKMFEKSPPGRAAIRIIPRRIPGGASMSRASPQANQGRYQRLQRDGQSDRARRLQHIQQASRRQRTSQAAHGGGQNRDGQAVFHLGVIEHESSPPRRIRRRA